MTTPGYADDVVLQFGRVDKNRFSMDVSNPLSLYQAFAVCVSCMDNKLADRKGFEFIKRLTATDPQVMLSGDLLTCCFGTLKLIDIIPLTGY